MLAFILRRLAQAIVVMLTVAFIAFMLFQYVGDPVTNLLGQDATPEQRNQLRADLGLDVARHGQVEHQHGPATAGPQRALDGAQAYQRQAAGGAADDGVELVQPAGQIGQPQALRAEAPGQLAAALRLLAHHHRARPEEARFGTTSMNTLIHLFGLMIGKALVGAGYPEAQAGFETLGNIGGAFQVGDATVIMVPAVHSSGFTDEKGEHGGGNPMGFVIQVKGGPVLYHTGDTDVTMDMRQIPERYGRVDVLLACIGGHFTMDPQGAAIAVFKPSGDDMALHDTSKEGEFCWNELVTSDPAAAFAFHSGLFGWNVVEDMDMGPMGTYRVYGLGKDGLGGMMRIPPGAPMPMDMARTSMRTTPSLPPRLWARSAAPTATASSGFAADLRSACAAMASCPAYKAQLDASIPASLPESL